MKWSFRVGQIAGIGVFIHWTFLLLIGWIALMHYWQDRNVSKMFEGVGFILALFGCVFLHELGHAPAAKRYGINTRDITLLPIGGLARLERIPEEPKQELVVALAGPMVNVIIAAILYFALAAVIRYEDLTLPEDVVQFVRRSFLAKLMGVNIMLVVFNMLPAFPMDGGRVLRALLATRMDYVRATRIAAGIGQFMAMLFGFWGLFGSNPFLLFIAMFVYLGAAQEAQQAEARSFFRNVPVSAAMVSRFRTLSESDTIGHAVKELLAGSQQDFPVVDGDRVAGLLVRRDMIRALAEGGFDRRVGEIMRRDCPQIEMAQRLDESIQRMHELECSSLPVVESGRLVGLLTHENVSEFVMVQAALREGMPESSTKEIVEEA